MDTNVVLMLRGCEKGFYVRLWAAGKMEDVWWILQPEPNVTRLKKETLKVESQII